METKLWNVLVSLRCARREKTFIIVEMFLTLPPNKIVWFKKLVTDPRVFS